ncbi:MAG: SusC/RagA family TonB-linked outer membrane protein [Bacteroidia bacterium]|nr:SusC/RagA family TonB-linked outer membrane protein [Bacteroidia bacterium]
MKKQIQNALVCLLFIASFGLYAQQTVSGVVTDESGNPLPSVNVVAKGTSTGVSTDFDGNYTISVANGSVLVFSSIGFETLELTVAGATLNATLSESASELDEVVVIGYGTTTVKDATGSVASITTEDFNQGAIVSSDQLLTGKVAGVVITNSGGAPDAAPNIRIRGGASLSAENSPLIVIDGVPLDVVTPAGVGNPLSLINPNDIASFSILKDASATAIYGSRASNGVILITTKKGTLGETKYNLSMSASMSEVSDKLELMNGPTFERFINEYHPTYANLLGVNGVMYNTDWQDAVFRTSYSSIVNFSVAGSVEEETPYRFSLGHTNTEGLVNTNDYERLSTTFRINPSFFDEKLKVDFNAKAFYVNKNAIDEGGALGNIVSMDPTKPIYDENSAFGGYYQGTRQDGGLTVLDGTWNPVAMLMQRQRPEKLLRILTNMELDYSLPFVEGLRAVVNVGLEKSDADIRETFSQNAIATYKVGRFNPGENYREEQSITNKTLEAYLAYTIDFDGLLQSLDAQAGYSYQNFQNEGTKELYQYDETSGAREVLVNENNPTNRYYSDLNLQSFFGRTNLNFAGKYLVTLSVRADASSLFAEDNRWGIFPAAAVAWRLSDETFIESLNVFDNLKLRAGWGETGQSNISGAVGYYPSYPFFQIGSATSKYLPGENLYNALMFNPNLTWEKTTTLNAGIDFGVFNGVLSGSVDVFKRDTNDLLANAPVPPGQAPASSFIDNIGSTESEGFEVSIDVLAIDTQNSSLNVFANGAYAKTTITDLNGIKQVGAGGDLPIGTGTFLLRHALNQQAGSAWVFRQMYNEAGEPVYNAFADLNQDGVITNDDRYLRAMRPNYTFGFGFNFNYKQLSLSSSFRGQYGGQVYNARRLTSGFTERPVPVNTQALSNVLNFYNGAANPIIYDQKGNVAFSDYFLEDASFIRCENITLGYAFEPLNNGTQIQASFTVNNAFLITKYSGQDPENFGGIDNNFYPRPRVFTLGLNFDF